MKQIKIPRKTLIHSKGSIGDEKLSKLLGDFFPSESSSLEDFLVRSLSTVDYLKNQGGQKNG
jgi:hypothetical protein